MGGLHHIRCIASLLTSFVLFAGAAAAETVEVHTVPLEVDALTRIDERLVEVRLGGTTRIVAQDRVDDFVLERYLREGYRVDELDASKLTAIARDAHRAGHSAHAGYAIARLALSTSATPEHLESLLTELATDLAPVLDPALDIVSEAASTAPSVFPLLLAAAERDIDRFRLRASGLVYRSGATFKQYLTKRYYEALFGKQFVRAAKLLEVFTLLYGPDDESYPQLALMETKVRQVVKALETESISSILPLIDAAAADDLRAPLVFRFLHDEAQALVTADRSKDAIVLLSRIPDRHSSPTTHEIVKRALQGIQTSDDVFADPTVHGAFAGLSRQNGEIAKRYADALRGRCGALLAEGRFGECSLLFQRLREINPDPSRINDELRLDFASALSREGREDDAREVLRAIQGELSIFQRVRVFLWRLYLEISLESLLLLATSFIVGLLFLHVRKRRHARSRVSGKPFGVEESEEEEEAPRFVRGGTRYDPLYEEYCQQLDILGLHPKATVSEIKGAYRRLMKASHPDTAQGADTFATESFLVVKRAYERALQLNASHQFAPK